MDDFLKDPVNHLQDALVTKTALKQRIWTLTQELFGLMKVESEKLSSKLHDKIQEHRDIVIACHEVDQFEFYLKFGGDTLSFLLQTNIVTFPTDYHIMQKQYLQGNDDLKYFGQILIYNFLSDSITYNRTDDAGYLLGRVFLNVENNLMIEGVRDLHYLFPRMEDAEANTENVSLLIKKAVDVSINSDLIGQEYQNVRFLTLGQKNAKTKEVGHGKKIGFQMKSDSDIEG